jgi:hypothetical protein
MSKAGTDIVMGVPLVLKGEMMCDLNCGDRAVPYLQNFFGQGASQRQRSHMSKQEVVLPLSKQCSQGFT